MAKYTEIPGSGRLRLTTAADVTRAVQSRSTEPPRQALVASAAKLTKGEKTAYMKRLSLGWQQQALFHYDAIGELHFATGFIARMLSRVRYFPARLESNGKLTEITEGPPVERLNKIQDPGGGRSRVQFSYGLFMFLTGEGVLFGYRLETEQERWKFLWKEEVKFLDDGRAVRLNAEKKETDDVGVGYRFWTPHPRHSDEPDSPVRAVLDICEELLILTASVRSTAVSRLTNGMMLIPQDLSPNQQGPLGDEDAENNIFLADYVEHISQQIENPGSAESKVPFLLEGSYEYLDRVRWMPTHDPQTDYLERELRKEAIHRMALGLDMPPEALLGMTDANHWTAKQVMHDMWRTHGVPKAEQFADDISDVYLRPGLEADEYEGWENVVVGMDDSQVVISPDRTEDADRADDRGHINEDTYLEMKGLDPSAKSSEEEKRVHLAVKLRNPALLKGTKFELDPAEMVAPGITGPQPSQNGNQDPSDGPPEPTGGRTGSRQESMSASGEIMGAARMALHRCREVAGARLRRIQQDCEECKEATDGMPNAIVAALLGEEQVRKLADPKSLVSGAAEGFRRALQEDWNLDGTQAHSLAQMIEVYAGRTLCEQTAPQLPTGFIAQVEKAKEVSDGISTVR